MSKVHVFIILVFAAVFSVTPHVLVSASDTIYSGPGYYRVDIPELGGAEFSPSCPTKQPESDLNRDRSPGQKDLGYDTSNFVHPGNAKERSTCKSEDSGKRSNNINRLDSPGMWQYAGLKMGVDR
jgi:hypothetical protein